MKVQTQAPSLPPPDATATDRRDPKLLAASRMYEKQFLREMVAAMRKTVNDSGLVEVGMGEKIFREKLDDEYVEVWGDRGGIGLGDLIYQQVLEKYGANVAPGYQPPSGHHGVFPLDQKSVGKVLQKKQNGAQFKTNQIQMKILPNHSGADLKNPWPGRLLGKGLLDDGRSFLKIGHDNGLVSEFVYRGSLPEAALGAALQPDQTIGRLEAQLAWNIRG